MNNPAENLQNMLCIQPVKAQNSIGDIENSAIQALACSNSTAPSHEFANFLHYVEEHGQTVSQELAAGIDHLQELFLGALHQSFLLANITVDSRMIISLNSQGKLHIESSCAEQEQIREILSASKALPALLKLISVQSSILDGISKLRLVAEAQDSGGSEKFSMLQQAYRVCLKGRLSHFYST